MKHTSRSSWVSRAVGVCVMAGLLAGAAGCESMQRKFTRKPKHPVKPLDPIIKFEDYTQAMTPLDKYRKHFMMFNYWNTELIEALQHKTPNPKRFRRASADSLAELQTLRSLVAAGVAERFAPIITERQKIDQRLQRPGFMPSHASSIVSTLERQTRAIQREFFWRDVEDSIQEPATAVGEDAPAP